MGGGSGYSSTVKIALRIGDKELDVAQVGNETLILRDDPGSELSGEAELSISVDGEATEYQILLRSSLPEGRHVLSYT